MEVVMKKIMLSLTLILVLALLGCGTWKVTPFTLNNNPHYDITMTTLDYCAYHLTVTNKTKSNLEIVWERTFYIDQTNVTNGFLMFDQELTAVDTLKGSRYPVIIFPNERMEKNIYPVTLAYLRKITWVHNYLPEGSTGVFLTLKLNGKELNHRLYIDIDYP